MIQSKKGKNMIDINKFIKENSDLQYADFSKKLIPTQYQILGIRIPTLRKFAKDLEPEYIELNKEISHEEIMLYGFAAGNAKIETEQMEYLQNLLPFIDNWATCDCIVQSLKKMKGEKSYLFFKNLLSSENEFFVRVGIIGMMRYFIKSPFLDEILKDFSKIKNDQYYVKMALAWFYAELCVTNVNLAKQVIANIDDKFVRNKSISKARESYRVSKEDKEELAQMRIK